MLTIVILVVLALGVVSSGRPADRVVTGPSAASDARAHERLRDLRRVIDAVTAHVSPGASRRLRARVGALHERARGAPGTPVALTVSKGARIEMCLRNPDGELLPLVAATRVLVHELAHVVCDEVGHTPQFYLTEAQLLRAAVVSGHLPDAEVAGTYCGAHL